MSIYFDEHGNALSRSEAPAMTTDPKALIEELENEASHLGDKGVMYGSEGVVRLKGRLVRSAQALRDLTAENERLTERNEALALQADEWEGKYAIVSGMNARLKALGDGLAESLKVALEVLDHEGVCEADCLAHATANSALAAWETPDEA